MDETIAVFATIRTCFQSTRNDHGIRGTQSVVCFNVLAIEVWNPEFSVPGVVVLGLISFQKNNVEYTRVNIKELNRTLKIYMYIYVRSVSESVINIVQF